MRAVDSIVAGARSVLVRAMSVSLQFPRLSGWIVEQLRRFPWLYLKLFNIFRVGSGTASDKRLIESDLTPATKEVLDALRLELAKSDQSRG